MKRIIMFVCIFCFVKVYADEGMWILSMLNKKYNDLKKQGLKLTPEDIYQINQASLKDAIVGLATYDDPLSFFCSGSIVSRNGLVFTNHHCGFNYIQNHSTLEHNYLADGFWAKNLNEELPNKDLCVSILLQIIDVSKEIFTPELDTITDIHEKQYIIEQKIYTIEERYKDEPYLAKVVNMFNGNQYLLFLYETYYDVRLVGAPPSDIGKFGGDTDNWMWPRHTGDFCIFRIYTSPDGKPEPYSPNNVPLQPKRYLNININGIEKNDFTMIIGFPGNTNRFYTSYSVENEMNIIAPTTVKIREEKLRIISEQMKQSNSVKLKYASKYSDCSNYYKYYIGQMQQVKKNQVIQKKIQTEQRFNEWIRQDTNRLKKYGWIIPYFKKYYETNNNYFKAYVFLNEAIFQGSDFILLPYYVTSYLNMLSDQEHPDSAKAVINEITLFLDDFYKNIDIETEKRLVVGLLSLHQKEFSDLIELIDQKKLNKKYKGNIQLYVNSLFQNSIYSDKSKLLSLIKNYNFKHQSKFYDDFFYILKNCAWWYLFNNTNNDSLNEAYYLWTKAQMEMFPDSIFYPDANGTIRLTYGKVIDYYPRDAVHYDYYTTIDGIMQKEDTTNEEFRVPPKLKKLYELKDYKPYSKDQSLPVCFITNNDITGGNSGSPVMDANGNLIGLAFDGNWEAMSGDIYYEKDLQRTICVDIRYVLFIIDKFANAKNIINELNIIQ
ncbi:MAG: S46 family peptidase [Bacteroidales bacterium]|nr:S46 family peptidase [Bacteroidales bacterium]